MTSQHTHILDIITRSARAQTGSDGPGAAVARVGPSEPAGARARARRPLSGRGHARRAMQDRPSRKGRDSETREGGGFPPRSESVRVSGGEPEAPSLCLSESVLDEVSLRVGPRRGPAALPSSVSPGPLSSAAQGPVSSVSQGDRPSRKAQGATPLPSLPHDSESGGREAGWRRRGTLASSTPP